MKKNFCSCLNTIVICSTKKKQLSVFGCNWSDYYSHGAGTSRMRWYCLRIRGRPPSGVGGLGSENFFRRSCYSAGDDDVLIGAGGVILVLVPSSFLDIYTIICWCWLDVLARLV